MDLTTDINLNATSFDPNNIATETKHINTQLEQLSLQGPRWYKVGAENYRRMLENNETTIVRPLYLPNAIDDCIPSRDAGRDIPIRVYKPENGKPSKGILLHFHFGGFVLFTHKHSDTTLQRYANSCQLTAISVGYRLSPENVHPAAVHDCFDAAEHLADHGEEKFGARLLVLAGDSAGACLAATVAFHLMRSRPALELACLVLTFGWFDLTLNLPQPSSFEKPQLLNREGLLKFREAYAPGLGAEELKNPNISPLYEQMQELALRSQRKQLPPALFLCGTEDPLLDDTLLMGLKWMTTGSEAVVKIFPGAPHGFTAIPGLAVGEEAWGITMKFVEERVRR